ncbi:RNA-binding domain-containing protein [Fructilactobacillus sp. Tb1]|uniref:RNA-binding domain-containing protein n=1 Tax=Fructilactobacillus sp. Tb1 TaxID=3422304 RepID=UPI003D29048E
MLTKKDLPTENVHVEYKLASKNKLPKSIWETISSFSNTDGGKIYLGIDEDIKTKELTINGITDFNKLKTNFLNTQSDKDKISRSVVLEKNINLISIDGKNVMTIFVPKLNVKYRPIYLNGNIKLTYIRENDSDRKVSEEQLKYLLRESDSDIDSVLLDNFNISDLNLIDIQSYQARLVEYTGNEEYLTSDYQSFLEKIGLIATDRTIENGKKKLRIAALLLFGKYNSIVEKFPNFFLDFIVRNNNQNKKINDRIYTSNEPQHPQNIYSFFSMVSLKLQAIITNELSLDKFKRVDSGEEMFNVVREGLVNSLVHADYGSKEQVKISYYDDYIVFQNPGDMRVSTSQFMIGGDSEARNPFIFNAFVRAKLGERTGNGGLLIYDTSYRYKLRTPEIKSEFNRTVLTFWKIPLEESVLNNIPKEYQETYKFMCKHLIVKFSDIKKLYKSEYQGHKILNGMVKDGYIEKDGERKGTRYSLPNASPTVQMIMNRMAKDVQDSLKKGR